MKGEGMKERKKEIYIRVERKNEKRKAEKRRGKRQKKRKERMKVIYLFWER